MYDLLGIVKTTTIFSSINLMSVYAYAKFQQCCGTFAKSAALRKIRLIFRYRELFLRTPSTYLVQVNVELSGVDGAGGSTNLMQETARFSGVYTGGITI
jgi:hypothetical protein